MSLPPITIPDLDPAGPVDGVNDQMLIRQGLNDRRINPDALFSFQLGIYSTLSSPLTATDVILIGRNNGSGYTNLITDPRRLGFLSGVFMWFYTNTAPLFWTNVPSLGDKVLAVKGGSQAYTNQGTQGTWQQLDTTLTINQIPAHTHSFKIYTSDEKGNLEAGKVSSSSRSSNLNLNTTSTGGGAGHNHGNIWRPAAAVGLVCQKTG
jgi:hypothetical protein